MILDPQKLANVGAVAGGLIAGKTLAPMLPVSPTLKPMVCIAAGLLLVSLTTGVARSVGVGLAAGAAVELAKQYIPLPV